MQHSSPDVSGAAPAGSPAAYAETRNGMAQPLRVVTFETVSQIPPAPTGGSDGPAPAGAGDYGAFFRATLAPLRRYIARLVGSQDEAQDIAQDAYARVYSAMRECPVDHPRALLYTTARHLAIDELKHRGRSPFAEASVDAALSPAPAIEALVMAREEAGLLAQAIERLSDECRAVLLLRMGEHLTHEQVATRLGLTKKQAEKRLHRAVRQLQLDLYSPRPAPTVPDHSQPPRL